MRKVEFEQGSQAWLDWRKGLLTATDAPMLLGASPYTTPYKGWLRKTGQAAEQQENEAMRRGKRDEPIAREWFNKEYGIEMEPCCIESELYNFIGSSLDGLSTCGRYILEIKSNGDQYHFGLNAGLPDFHMMQMQHQLLSTDNTAEMGFYLSWNKGSKTVKEVYPDKEWMAEYLPKAREFWKLVVFNEPPPMSNKDYRDMSGERAWISYANEYRNICEQIKKLEDIKENHRKQIINLCGEDSCFGSGIKVLKKATKGRIDYDSIPELTGIDIEKYRKPASFSWAIMMDNK
jgi:putative phage-type endonuclease